MAQIDREEGNQSALGEAFNSHNHSHTFEKKKDPRSIHSLKQSCQCSGRRRTD